MALKIVPHAPHLAEAVGAFNQRMRDGGSRWGFYTDPVPDWMPFQDGAPAWREYHVALDDEGFVRAGYALKPQQWWIADKLEWVTDWQGPFTEGAVNPRYAPLGLRMLRDMLAKYPLLYSFGHGGSEEPMVQLLRSLKWTLHGTPFCLRILNPARFLRLNGYLRRTRRLALIQDALAMSGLGAVSLGALHQAIKLRYSRPRSAVHAEVVGSFGAWADELWVAHRVRYRCLAVRDSRMMNRLLPAVGWPGGTRLRMNLDDRPIGWAVVHHRQMIDDPRFGSLHVGLISDCFGDPADAAAIVAASHEYLASKGVDLICSNQAHRGWVDGFRSNGYVVLENRRLFAISPQLRERLEPFDQTIQGLHLTNMDGHGPHGFEDSTERLS
ncbi:MAG: hypothetical protein KF911_12025 [Pseudomonadales bacterium]|nr:hypothetical protein [Pseudomonadales bacterium]